MKNPLDVMKHPNWPADWQARALQFKSHKDEAPSTKAIAAYLTVCLEKEKNPSVNIEKAEVEALAYFGSSKTPFDRAKSVFKHYASAEPLVKSFLDEKGFSIYTLWEGRKNGGGTSSTVSKKDEDVLLGVRPGVTRRAIIDAIIRKIRSQASYKVFVQAVDRSNLVAKDFNIRDFFTVFSVSSQTPQDGYERAKQKVLLAVGQSNTEDQEYVATLDRLFGSDYREYMNKLLAGS